MNTHIPVLLVPGTDQLLAFPVPFQSDGWGLLSTRSCPQFRRIQRTWEEFKLHTNYFGVSENIKPLLVKPIDQAAEFKFESRFKPLQIFWQSLPQACRRLSQKSIEDFDCKINDWVLGQRSCTAWVGQTGEHKHRAFQSRRQSLLAATALEENMLPFLRYWLSWRVKKVSMKCKYRAATTHFFFHKKWKFRWNCREVTQKFLPTKVAPIASLNLWSFIGPWAKIWHRNKTACSANLNQRLGPVLEKGVCLDSTPKFQTGQPLQMAAQCGVWAWEKLLRLAQIWHR